MPVPYGSQNKEEKHTSVKFSHSPHTINKRNTPVSCFHIHLTQSTRKRNTPVSRFHIHLTQSTRKKNTPVSRFHIHLTQSTRKKNTPVSRFHIHLTQSTRKRNTPVSHSSHTTNKEEKHTSVKLSHSPHTTDWYTFHIILIARCFWKTLSGSKWNTGQAHVNLVQQNSILFINGHWIKWNDQRLGKTNSATGKLWIVHITQHFQHLQKQQREPGGWREGGDSGGDMMILVEETWLLSSRFVASCQPHWYT